MTSLPAAGPRRRVVWVALVVTNLLLAGLTTYYGRRFHIDETWYKAAGLHLAVDGRFAAPEVAGAMPGRVTSDVVFASQPPVYPAGFAAVVAAVGFGPDQVVAYDAAIRVGLSLVAYGLLANVAGGGWAAAGVAVMPWTLGISGRPDELGMAFGVAAVLLARRDGTAGVVSGGVALGLAAATSVGCGVVYGVACVAVVWRWRPAAGVLAVAAVVFAGCVAPVWVGHPGSIDQFRANGREATAMAGFARKWRGIARADNPAWPVLVGLSVVVVGLAVVPGRHRRLAVAAVVAFAFVVLRLPGKYPYLWMVAPVAAAAVYGWARAGGPPAVRRVVVGGLLLLAGVGSITPVRDGVLFVMCPPDLRARAAVARLRPLVPDGAVVLCDEAWPVLGARCRVRDCFFTADRLLPTVQVVVVSGNGSAGVGQVRRLGAAQAADVRDHFRLAADMLPRWDPRLLGVRLGRASYGYGFDVFRRTSPDPPGR